MSDGVNGFPAPERDAHGHFAPGNRGNPAGYTKADRAARKDVQEAARRHTAAALKVLVNVMTNTHAPHSARVQAADAILDRGWGRPPVTAVVAERQEITVRWLSDDEADIDPGEAEVRARAKWIDHE